MNEKGSSLFSILFAITLLGVFSWVITLFEWPEIGFLTEPLQKGIGYMYTFNATFPVDTLMTIFILVLGIEAFMLGVRFIGRLLGFVSGHKAPTEDTKL